MRSDCEIGSSDGSVSCGSGPGPRPTSIKMSEIVGFYGNGMKGLPRPRRSRRSAYQMRRYAKAIGMLIVFAAAIAIISAAALAPSAEKAKGPMTNKATPFGTLPPVASFITNINNLIVTVDASASYDPDGTIASYSWDWGDGTPVNTTVTAWHAYATPGTWWITLTVTDNDAMTGSSNIQVTVDTGALPPPPYSVWGYVTDAALNPIYGATATVVDLRTGAVWTYTDVDLLGFYSVDLNSNATGWAAGDTINVTLVKDTLIGWNEGIALSPGNEAYLELDAELSVAIPEFSTVVLPVVGIVVLVALLGLKSRRDER